MGVEPVAGEAAAVASIEDERVLVVADYHAGLESSMHREGFEVPSRATDRRATLLGLVERTGVGRVLFLGDLATAIGDPPPKEREELLALLTSLDVPVTVVKGNHDGEIEAVLETADVDYELTPARGVRRADIGFAHGHTWPAPAVLEASTVCVAHEHPMVRLEDQVGGSHVERVWLKGALAPGPFRDYHGHTDLVIEGNLIVFPAFNDLTSGTWVNSDAQEFLSPFLPAGLSHGEAFLLDGTRLGDFSEI